MDEPENIIPLFMAIGGTLGGYFPILWGMSYFSMPSLLFSVIGAVLGIWGGFEITREI